MSLLKHISNFLIEKVLPIKFKVWLLDRLACDIANQGEDGDTELAHINSYEAKLLRSVGGSGTLNSKTGLRQYGGGGSKSAPAPAATSTVVEKAEFPPELRPFITDILEKAQAQEQARLAAGYPVYPGPRIAQFTPEEKAAQAGIVSLVGSQEPTFDIAKGLTAASALEDTSGAIQQRMSPYMQNVVDIQKREAERGVEGRRQQLAAQGVAAGGYGGTREAFMQSELDRNLQQQLGDIQATGSQAAFQQAQQGLANLRQRQAQAGQQMAGMAPLQSGVQFKELGALAGVGEQQRQQQQKALDLGFQQFREEQTYPEASLQQYQSIIRGFPLQPTTTQTQQSILPTPSLGQQLIGMGTGALGLAGAAKTLFKEGGPLKQIPEGNEGLSKLPTDVRNKMGFMKSGKKPKITKKQNKMYKKIVKDMLYSMLDDDVRKKNTGGIASFSDGDFVGNQFLSQGLPDFGLSPSISSQLDELTKAREGLTTSYQEAADEQKRIAEEQAGLYEKTDEELTEIEKEKKDASKLQSYLQLAKMGGDILSADPSRGTFAAVGSAISEAAPGFIKTAKEFQGIQRDMEKEQIKRREKQLAAEEKVAGIDAGVAEKQLSGLEKEIGLGIQLETLKDTKISNYLDFVKSNKGDLEKALKNANAASGVIRKLAADSVGATLDIQGNYNIEDQFKKNYAQYLEIVAQNIFFERAKGTDPINEGKAFQLAQSAMPKDKFKIEYPKLLKEFGFEPLDNLGGTGTGQSSTQLTPNQPGAGTSSYVNQKILQFQKP